VVRIGSSEGTVNSVVKAPDSVEGKIGSVRGTVRGVCCSVVVNPIFKVVVEDWTIPGTSNTLDTQSKSGGAGNPGTSILVSHSPLSES